MPFAVISPLSINESCARDLTLGLLCTSIGLEAIKAILPSTRDRAKQLDRVFHFFHLQTYGECKRSRFGFAINRHRDNRIG